MISVKSIQINKLDFHPKKVLDLIYFEGPLLSLYYEAESNKYYLYKWTDSDEQCNRWMILAITDFELLAYLTKKMSLKQLIIGYSFVFLVDMNHLLETKQIMISNTQELPLDYLPNDDSFFDEDLSPLLEKEINLLKKEIRNQMINPSFPKLNLKINSNKIAQQIAIQKKKHKRMLGQL